MSASDRILPWYCSIVGQPGPNNVAFDFRYPRHRLFFVPPYYLPSIMAPDRGIVCLFSRVHSRRDRDRVGREMGGPEPPFARSGNTTII